MSDRPSYLDVDTRIVSGDPSLAALRSDPEWSAHFDATTPVLEVPEWVLALDRPRPWRWLLGIVAAAAVVFLLVTVPRDPYVGVKGSAAVLVHVKTARGSAPWDGAPLAVGDQVRIEVADLDSPWFAVVFVAPDEPPAVLGTGTENGLLDGAWALDAPGAGARIVVVGADREPATAGPSPSSRCRTWPNVHCADQGLEPSTPSSSAIRR